MAYGGYLGEGFRGEGDGGGAQSEVGGIKSDKASIGDDVEVDGDGAGEFARVEVWFQIYIVSFGHNEFGEPGLPSELLHFWWVLEFGVCKREFITCGYGEEKSGNGLYFIVWKLQNDAVFGGDFGHTLTRVTTFFFYYICIKYYNLFIY